MGRFLVAALILAAAKSAHAQNTRAYWDAMPASFWGTAYITADSQSVAGKLTACYVEFKAVQRDQTYNLGSPYFAYGSLTIQKVKDDFAVGLKLVVEDVSLNKDATIHRTPAVPHFVYLKSKSGQTNTDGFLSKAPSDTVGGLFSVYRLNDSFVKIYGEMLETQSVTIAFNRKEGGIDLNIPLDLTIVETKENNVKVRSSAAVDGFSDCVGKLIK